MAKKEVLLLQNLKNDFLANQFFLASWTSAVRHNKTWRDITEQEAKNDFRKKIKKEVENILLGYSDKCVTSEEHSKNIERLNKFSKENGEELNIGTCQKLLNLLCKYYWCAGWICEPPHATIDRQILAKLPSYRNLRWTEISDIGIYKGIASEVETIANGDGFSSPAAWELFNWQSEAE